MHVDVITGTCTCGPGFVGELCDQHCTSGFFGINCQQVCECDKYNSEGCDPVTGKCICKPNWKGMVVLLLSLYKGFALKSGVFSLLNKNYNMFLRHVIWVHLVVYQSGNSPSPKAGMGIPNKASFLKDRCTSTIRRVLKNVFLTCFDAFTSFILLTTFIDYLSVISCFNQI